MSTRPGARGSLAREGRRTIPHEHLRLTRALQGASLPTMTHDDYTDSTYGDRIAGIYDEWYLGTFAGGVSV